MVKREFENANFWCESGEEAENKLKMLKRFLRCAPAAVLRQQDAGTAVEMTGFWELVKQWRKRRR
jgi:hypothetical protein